MRFDAATCVVMFVGLLLLLTGAPARSGELPGAAAGQGPLPAREGLGDGGAFNLSKSDRCPVCGMFPARRPKHAAAMVLRDGRTYYFCSNGCLLRAWHLSETHLGVAADAVNQMRVRDYFSGLTVSAEAVWWVAGSDVIGPMGRAFVALDSPGAVKAFKERHGGSHVFKLEQVDQQLFDTLFAIQ